MRKIYVSILIALLFGACATFNSSKFMNAVVDCSKEEAPASLVKNVTECLTGVVAGGYIQCLELLPFAVDEIVCVVQKLSVEKAKAINSSAADPYDEAILTNANAWLKANNISRR